ncbi:MAG: hypothetical protein IT560_14805 [Alphaproteobacteria bacterium]|nr:hypothetical protein [Alphaproteobacteria bacterium]
MLSASGTKSRLNIVLVAALALNLAFWAGSRFIYAKWEGVPPVPTHDGAAMMALGDQQFAYRLGAITLQNLGDSGGRVTPIRNYDYARLGAWFKLLDDLDPASDHVPMLAAYYFGATRVPADVAVVVDYLSHVGVRPVGSKWRWLVQAVFLARHRLGDLQLALDLAYKLSKMQLVDDVLPGWARQMPAFVLKEQGDREDARKIITELLQTGHGFHPNEVNYMKTYLVEELGVPQAEVDKIMSERNIDDAGEYRRPRPAPEPE